MRPKSVKNSVNKSEQLPSKELSTPCAQDIRPVFAGLSTNDPMFTFLWAWWRVGHFPSSRVDRGALARWLDRQRSPSAEAARVAFEAGLEGLDWEKVLPLIGAKGPS